MCIIILNTKNTLTKETLQESWKSNPDGAGLMYSDGQRLKIFKELKNKDKFFKEYYRVRGKYPLNNIVLHFRIKTHGQIDIHNTHPFRVNKNLAFCHNGILSCVDVPKDSKLNDTILLNETILKNLPDGFEQNEAIIKLLEEFIGLNKIVLLDNLNQYTIINADMGHWKDGNWYSNYSYIQLGNYYGYKSNYRTFQPAGYCDYCRKSLQTELELYENMCEKCLVEEGYYTPDQITDYNAIEPDDDLEEGTLVSQCNANLEYADQYRTEDGKCYFYDMEGNKWYIGKETP